MEMVVHDDVGRDVVVNKDFIAVVNQLKWVGAERLPSTAEVDSW